MPQFRQNGRIFQKFNEIRASDLPIMLRDFLVPGADQNARLGLLIPKLACLESYPGEISEIARYRLFATYANRSRLMMKYL
jgi:hypothetical protein